MSAVVCGKRSSSYFEELIHAAGSPPAAKRARFVGSSSPPPPAWARAAADPTLVAELSARFPVMSLQLIEKALEESGNDLDSAINSLLNLHLDPVENNCDPAREPLNQIITEALVSVEGVTDDRVSAHSERAPSENLPSDGSEWVGFLVNEMSSASNMEDAKARASRLLEAFEKAVIPRVNAQALHEFQKENIMLREQVGSLTKENTILKRAFALQHERQKDYDVKNQEIQQMKQHIAQYQEQVRTLEGTLPDYWDRNSRNSSRAVHDNLEFGRKMNQTQKHEQVNNYALSMHLRQAQQSSSIPGRHHPDVY